MRACSLSELGLLNPKDLCGPNVVEHIRFYFSQSLLLMCPIFFFLNSTGFQILKSEHNQTKFEFYNSKYAYV